MKKELFVELLGDLDDELLLRADEAAERCVRTRKSRRAWLRWGTMAACLCLVACGAVAMLLGGPMDYVGPVNPAVPDHPVVTPGDEITGSPALEEPSEPAQGAFHTVGDTITGKQSEAVMFPSYDDATTGNDYEAEYAAIGFFCGTVVEARVVEVHPDLYFVPPSGRTYRVARLEILDELKGKGLPKEIHYLFPHRKVQQR